MDKEQLRKQPIQTLAKALLILESFSTDKYEWGIRELSRKLDINPTSVYRLIATLHNFGYLNQNPETRRYSLGPRIMKLGNMYSLHNPFSTIGRIVFEKYSNQFEYNFYLGTLSKFEVIYLAALDGRGPINILIDPGGTTALHSTALGKILLANQDDSFIMDFLQTSPLRKYTPRSITQPNKLWEQIEEIRESAYAVNDGEHYEDVGAVGVPVIQDDNIVTLGVSLAYPRHFIQEGRIRIADLIPLAREVAAEISFRCGY